MGALLGALGILGKILYTIMAMVGTAVATVIGFFTICMFALYGTLKIMSRF